MNWEGKKKIEEMDDLSVCATLEDEPKEKVPWRSRTPPDREEKRRITRRKRDENQTRKTIGVGRGLRRPSLKCTNSRTTATRLTTGPRELLSF